MIMACDLRVSVPGANLFYPVVKHGFTPPPADPGRMVSLIGPARTKMILLGGQKIPAPEAMSWGLLDRLSDDPLTTAIDLCAAASAAPKGHIHKVKAMI